MNKTRRQENYAGLVYQFRNCQTASLDLLLSWLPLVQLLLLGAAAGLAAAFCSRLNAFCCWFFAADAAFSPAAAAALLLAFLWIAGLAAAFCCWFAAF